MRSAELPDVEVADVAHQLCSVAAGYAAEMARGNEAGAVNWERMWSIALERLPMLRRPLAVAALRADASCLVPKESVEEIAAGGPPKAAMTGAEIAFLAAAALGEEPGPAGAMANPALRAVVSLRRALGRRGVGDAAKTLAGTDVRAGVASRICLALFPGLGVRAATSPGRAQAPAPSGPVHLLRESSARWLIGAAAGVPPDGVDLRAAAREAASLGTPWLPMVVGRRTA